MNFNELAAKRRSIRGFSQREVTDEQIAHLLLAAQAAPSGGNCQPWHFYVIRNQELIGDIRAQACQQDFITSAPLVIVVCVEPGRSERYGSRGRNLYCIQDTAAAVENILLCVTDIGLSSCWCGAFDEEKLAQLLQLPKERRPIALLPIGYALRETVMPRRRPLEEIATFID